MNRTIVHLLAPTAVAVTGAAGLARDPGALAVGLLLAVAAGAVLLTGRHRVPVPQPVPVRVRATDRRPR